ncbi:flippase [bacterium]|nr:flippase [bacterium]
MSFSRAFAKNAVFKGLGEVIIRLLSFAFVVLVARVVGDESFGIINFAFSFSLLFVVIVDFGLNPLLIRDAAKDPAQTRNLFFNLLLMKLVLATLFFFTVLIGVRWAASDAATVRVVLWMALFVMLNSFTEFINSVFHAHQKMQYEALVMSLQKLGLLLFGIGALQAGLGIQGVAMAYVAAGALGVLLAAGLLLKGRFLPGAWKWDITFFKYVWQQALPLTVTTLFINLYFRIDMTLLAKLRSSAEVGWYGAAHKCIEVLMVIPAVLVIAAFPGFSKLFRENREQLIRANTKVIKLLLLLGAPIAGGAWVVANPLMILIFGEAYAPSGAALGWLALALCMIFLNYALSYLLISCERQMVNAVVSGIAVIVSIGANLLLIPRIGHVGAAMAAVVTEVFLFVAYLTAVHRLLFPVPVFKMVLRVLVSVGLMLSVIVWMRELNVFLVLATAAGVYTVAIFGTRAIEKDDLELFVRMFKRKV